jgi:HlyD family secretion protein
MFFGNHTVLLIQRSQTQTTLWEIALSSRQIATISESPDISLRQVQEKLIHDLSPLPSLILVDMHLSNLDFIELCHWCSDNYPDLKIILTSKFENILPQVRHEAIDLGVWDVLPRLQHDNLDISLHNNLDCIVKHLESCHSLSFKSPFGEDNRAESTFHPSAAFFTNFEDYDEREGTDSDYSLSSTKNDFSDGSLEQSLSLSQQTNFVQFPPILTFPSKKILITFLIGVSIIVSGLALWIISSNRKQATSNASGSAAPNGFIQKVVARGTIIPEWDIIKLSVPNAQDSRVDRIFVKQGDRVKANQVIAILQGSEQLKTELRSALANVDLLQVKLEKVKQGDQKPAAFDVQRSTLNRLRNQASVEIKQKQSEINSALATRDDAGLNLSRQQMLYSHRAVSRADLEKAQKDFDISQAALDLKLSDLEQSRTSSQSQIAEEQAKLVELQQVRPVDVAIAQQELEKAILEAESSRYSYENTLVRVPVSGQILRINTKVGEQVNTELGIVDLGRTQQMYVQAEIYESDLPKVRKSQRATIVSEYGGFDGEIHGTVDNFDLQVGKPLLLKENNDPTTDDNSRVIQASIRIDPKDSPKVSNLTKMQVRVTIESN